MTTSDSSSTGGRSPPSSWRTCRPTRSTARRPTCAWSRARPRSSWRRSLEAARDELVRGLSGLLGRPVPAGSGTALGSARRGGRGHARELGDRAPARPADAISPLGDEGYVIRSVSQRPGVHHHRREHRGRRPVRHLRLPAPHADGAAHHEPGHRDVAPDREPPPEQLGDDPPVRRQQRVRDGRPERRERDDLQLRGDRPERRAQPARDPRPLHRGRARARVGRHQRLRDQPRQRRQRLPDVGLHRPGGGAGRRAAPVRDQDLPGHQLHGAHRPAVRARHADERAARPLRRRVPGLVEPQGPTSSRRRSRTSWGSP